MSVCVRQYSIDLSDVDVKIANASQKQPSAEQNKNPRQTYFEITINVDMVSKQNINNFWDL